MANTKQKSNRTQGFPIRPDVIFEARISNRILFRRLEGNGPTLNQRLFFIAELLGGRGIPRKVIQSIQGGVAEAISSATNVASAKVEKLKAVLVEKKVRLTERQNHPVKTLACTSSSPLFSDYISLVDTLDEAIWIIEGLATARLIKHGQDEAHVREMQRVLAETDTRINAEYSRAMGVIKADGKVNEVAVAMPIDKSVAQSSEVGQ